MTVGAEADSRPALPGCDATAPDSPGETWLCAVGSRSQMFEDQDLSGRIDLADLEGIEGLVAVGPIEGLQGEVTIYDGTAYVSTLVDGAEVVSQAFAGKAIFLAFGSAPEWRPVPIPRRLVGLAAIETFVAQSARAEGLDLDRAFPFRIEGTVERLEYHVIFKSNDAVHTMAEHRKAKIGFRADAESIRIAGVWADAQGEGRFTHPGKRTHLHAVRPGGVGAGHVDSIVLAAGATLYLPTSPKGQGSDR